DARLRHRRGAGRWGPGARGHIARLWEALARRGCDRVALPATRRGGRIGPGGSVLSPAPGSPPLEGTGVASWAADLDSLDALLVRFLPEGSLDQIVFRVDALHAVHDAGLPVVNPPRAIERTVDKHWTSQLLAR